MGQAMLNPLFNHLKHQRMQPEWGRDKIPNARVLGSCRGGQPWNVFIPMSPGQQEVRKDNDGCRSMRYATIECRGHRRLGQFHVRRLDDRVPRCRRKGRDHFEQQVVALGTPRPMIDENYAE